MATKKILAVDDSVSIRKSIGFILGQQGFEVVEAVDGADGEQQFNFHARETGLIEEIRLENLHCNREGNSYRWDAVLMDFIMKEGWSTRWKSLLIWVCGYLSIIAFAVAGGYAIVKSNDEELKSTAKKAFIVTLIFTLIAMFLGLYDAIGGMTDGYYSSAAYGAYSVMSKIVTIAKIVVFVVFAALSLRTNGVSTAGAGQRYAWPCA